MRLCHSDTHNITKQSSTMFRLCQTFDKGETNSFKRLVSSISIKEVVGQFRLAGIKTLACFKSVFTQIHEYTELLGKVANF